MSGTGERSMRKNYACLTSEPSLFRKVIGERSRTVACKYFNDEKFGYCAAAGADYVPTLYEMERYCFSKYVRTCPKYGAVDDKPHDSEPGVGEL